jgi:hypothetical protein
VSNALILFSKKMKERELVCAISEIVHMCRGEVNPGFTVLAWFAPAFEIYVAFDPAVDKVIS